MQETQANPLKNFLPVWRIASPFVQQQAANAAANHLNQRRRKRLGLPEPIPEGCPPVDFTLADCPPVKTRFAAWSVVLSCLLGVVIGVVLGHFFGFEIRHKSWRHA